MGTWPARASATVSTSLPHLHCKGGGKELSGSFMRTLHLSPGTEAVQAIHPIESQLEVREARSSTALPLP